jgi:hypothetical protein
MRLGELPLELQDVDLEVGRCQLGATFLADVSHRFQYVAGRTQVEPRINRMSALRADKLVGQRSC